MNDKPYNDSERELAAVEAEKLDDPEDEGTRVTSKLPAPKKPVPKAVDKREEPSRVGRALSLVFFCFVASLLGSWVFLSSGLVKLPASSNITESRQQLVQEGEVVADVAKTVSPSVVSIVTESTSQDTFFSRSFTQQGAGTGIIISKDGYILTNRHVIPTSTTEVEVVLSDGTSYKNVQVVGRDPLNDLAFLKIDGVNNLTPAEFGDSAEVTVGQKVIAIGNALGQYQNTVTSGIISGSGRPVTATDGTSNEQLENLIQTDAAINPGNSGGPLVTYEGKVIGINTAVAEGAQGIGFAIPINDAKGLIKGVLNTGKVARAYLGVRYLSITPEVARAFDLKVKDGAYINSSGGQPVVPGSPADKAGLKDKDVITKVNDAKIDSAHPLASVLGSYAPGDTVTLTVLREGKEQQIKVTLAEYQP